MLPQENPQPRVLLEGQRLSCNRSGRTLFTRLSFRLPAGQLLQVVGPNGSGKSSLLAMMARLIDYTEGHLKGETGLYIGHQQGYSNRLTVRQNLLWFIGLEKLEAAEAAKRKKSLDDALIHFDLRKYANLPCSMLSSGQKRKLALARLMVTPAPLWLVDEPLALLDKHGQQVFLQLLADHLQQGNAAVICLQEAKSSLGDYVIHM